MSNNRYISSQGPKQFQANLHPIAVNALLQEVHRYLSSIISKDRGGPFWRVDRERRFIQGQPKGKWISAQGGYEVAKEKGTITISVAATSLGDDGTMLVVGFEDSLGWSTPNSEVIVNDTIRHIDNIASRLSGPRRWVKLLGGWRYIDGFHTVDELDQPAAERATAATRNSLSALGDNRCDPADGKQKAIDFVQRRRLALETAMPMHAIVNALHADLDRPGRRGWRGKWSWSASGMEVEAFWVREVQRRTECEPLSPVGEELLAASAGSSAAAKLDVAYRYVLTTSIALQATGKSVVQLALEETIDPDHRHDHHDVRPHSHLEQEMKLLDRLRAVVVPSGGKGRLRGAP